MTENLLLNKRERSKEKLYHDKARLILKYEGDVENNKANGEGISYYDYSFMEGYKISKKEYEGWWENGKKSEKGISYYDDSFNNSDKKEYDGDWENGERNGQGTSYYKDGEIKYEGQWKDNKRYGNGVSYRELTGIKSYEGEWKNDKKNGKGTYFFQDGSRYEGEWKNDKQDGTGTQYYPNGTVEYEGELKNGVIDGKGTRYYPDGTIEYDGEWKDNKQDGKGTQYYPNGTIEYEGEWKDGTMDGKGIHYYPDGTIEYDGEWKNDKQDGTGIYINKIKNIILYGSFLDGIPQEGGQISDSELTNFNKNDNQLSVIESQVEQSKFIEKFLEELSKSSRNTQLQAIQILEKNKFFLNYLLLKINSVNNLSEEINNVNNDLLLNNTEFSQIYLQYLEAKNLCTNPNQYEGKWNLEYLKHIKEFENLSLTLDGGKVLKQHNLYEFNQEEDKKIEKLSNIEAYDQALIYALHYFNNDYLFSENEQGIKFIHIKNEGISSKDFLIFFIDQNEMIDNFEIKLESIIKNKKPAVHGISYYFCKSLDNQELSLSGGIQLSQNDYLSGASNVIKAGLDNDQAAQIFLIGFQDTKYMENDDELFELINEHKNCAILFNKNGKNIPLDVSGFSKEKPSNLMSPKDSNKMIEDDKEPQL